MAKTTKTEAERWEEANRQAEEALKSLPSEEEQYATGSVEEDERRDEAEAKAEAQARDRESSATDRARLDRIEQALVQLQGLIGQARKAGVVPAPGQLVDPDGYPVQSRLKSLGPEHDMDPIRLFISPSEDPAQNRPIEGTINGTLNFRIPRGEIVTVPRCVAVHVQSLVFDTWEHPIIGGRYANERQPGDPPMTLGIPIHKQVPRFPVMIYQ